MSESDELAEALIAVRIRDNEVDTGIAQVRSKMQAMTAEFDENPAMEHMLLRQIAEHSQSSWLSSQVEAGERLLLCAAACRNGHHRDCATFIRAHVSYMLGFSAVLLASLVEQAQSAMQQTPPAAG